MDERTARDMSAQELAKTIREALKAAVKSGELPKATYYVRQTWSGYTPKIQVTVKGYRGQMFAESYLEAAGLGEATWRMERYTPEAKAALTTAEQIASRWNYDESNLETDYFCVGYYLDVAFGDARAREVEEAKAWGLAGVVAA